MHFFEVYSMDIAAKMTKWVRHKHLQTVLLKPIEIRN